MNKIDDLNLANKSLNNERQLKAETNQKNPSNQNKTETSVKATEVVEMKTNQNEKVPKFCTPCL